MTGKPRSHRDARRWPAPGSAPVPEPAAPAPQPSPAPGTESSGPPAGAELTSAWETEILESLKPRAKALYKPGRFVEGDERVVRFALPNQAHLEHCADKVSEVSAAASGEAQLEDSLATIQKGWADNNQVFHGASGNETYHLFTNFPVNSVADLNDITDSVHTTTSSEWAGQHTLHNTHA